MPTAEELAKALFDQLHANDEAWVMDQTNTAMHDALTVVVIDGRFDLLAIARRLLKDMER
jgi:hypothetical protein